MTQEAQERFDEIVNRFEKMDHRHEALGPQDAAFLINEVARLSKDTIKFVGNVIKINPKSGSAGRRLEVTFSGVYNTDLLKEIGVAFDESVTVYIDREMGQLQMFNDDDVDEMTGQMDIFEEEPEDQPGPRIVGVIEGPVGSDDSEESEDDEEQEPFSL